MDNWKDCPRDGRSVLLRGWESVVMEAKVETLQHLAILQPVVAPPRQENLTILSRGEWSADTLKEVVQGWDPSDVMALDIETQGSDPVSSSSSIVGISLADKRGSIYLETCSTDDVRLIGDALASRSVRLIGHNLFFDASYLYRDIGYHLNWAHCTYALYKYLATEGYPGQSWGLKGAQVELLGWENSNESELDLWLINNGWIADTKVEETSGYYWIPDRARWCKPRKEEMWRAPVGILGYYGCLDADSTYLLFKEVLQPGMRKTAGGRHHEGEYYGPTFIKVLRALIEQRFSGISIDVSALHKYNAELHQRIEESEVRFRKHPDVRPALDQYRQSLIDAHLSKEPAQFKKLKVPEEPPRLKKNGEVSANWLKWNERKEAGEFSPQESKNWQGWKEKLEALKASDPFNIHSGPQKQWLFYQQLGYKPLLFTDSGQPAVDERALKGFGEPGQLLIANNELVKEQSYVQAVVDNLQNDKLHLSFRIPGTVTGRLAGAGGVNCFLPGTELLTKRGWIDVLHVTKEDYVWQVEPVSKVGSWTKPQVVIKQEWDGMAYHFGGMRGELSVTANHRMAWYGSKNQKHKYLYTREAQSGIATKRTTVLGGSESVEFPTHLYREIWIAAMLQADGSRPKGNSYVVGFRKERKIKKAEELVGHTARKVVYKNGTTYFRQIEFSSDLLCPETKTLTLSGLSTHHAAELLQAISFWDGNVITVKGGIRVEYNSTLKKNVDELQAYFSRAGYHTSIRKYKGWRLYITDNLHRDYRPEKHLRITEYKGPVGCVSVPTEHLLVRSGGLVWVSGNCQQMPKSRGFLETWKCRPSYRVVEFDFTAVEQVVLAELSRDPSLWKLYGPTARPNDIYLFTGAYLPVIGPKIRAAGYDPNDPTPEGISAAKKLAKKERQIAKTVVLGSSYGAGAPKIAQTLRLSGVEITDTEAKAIHQGYWTLYKGVKEYEAELVRQWNRNDGWVYNGIGRPIGVAEDYLKDIINRVVQSTAHDCLFIFLSIVIDQLDKAGIDWKPWILDWHDELMIEVREDQAEQAARLIDGYCLDLLNQQLGGKIKLKGNSEIVDNLAQIKCAD